MKESLRRVILFTITVITGSVMILFDVPPVLMIPLLFFIGFVILIGLGAITIADLRQITNNAKPGNLKKISIIKRLNEMKFFEKTKAVPPGKQSPTPPSKTPKPGKPVTEKAAEKKPGIGSHLGLFVSSLGSLGTVLRERSKRGKKVEDINKLLDKTVSEKVNSSALARAGNVGSSTRPDIGGAGTATTGPLAEQDPFLSLSGDEFDPGLLDGLDDGETNGPSTSVAAENSENLAPDELANESGIPTPSLDISSEADEILKGNSPGTGEFSGLEGGDSIDQDFGDLGDLDDLNLDDVTLDDESGDETGKTPPDTAETPKEKISSMPSGPAVKEIKTDWIKSDAPAGNEDQVSTQADMAAFASSSGADDDLLSSIASDVKHTKKEKDISLLRELKDFRAPAEEIEKELAQVSERIHAIPRTEKNAIPPTKEIK
jgi:hypothetical protein